METARQTQNEAVEYVETELYMFAPSIGKRRTVDGKTYIVRSYFAGGKDFERAMERLAARQARNKNAG